MKRILLPNYVKRTGAKFETTERFLKNTYVVNSTESTLENVGIPLTRTGNNTYATSTEELHCFIIGDSGSGKTRRVVMPSIRLLAKSGESMIISDPKGELYRTTAKALEEKGYKVQVLNLRKPRRSNRWNPLGLVESLYRSEDQESKEKALTMLNEIIDVLKERLESADDPYWTEAAGNIFRGISMLILEYGNPGELSFNNVANTGRAIYKELSSNSRISSSLDGRTFKQFLESLPKESPIVHNLSPIITNASDTRNCIMSSFENMIALYSSYDSLIDLFSESEIDLKSLGLTRTALFIILPDDTESLYPIATVLVEEIYSILVALADEQEDGKLPNRVTFLLDEFANFTKMPSIASMLTAARSRNMRFILVCQSMDQLNKKYGESDRETLMSNCRLWLYMKCRNLAFLNNLEALMDNYISPYTGASIPLITKSELQQFEIGQVLILNDRCRPMMGMLPDYSQYDFGEGDFSPAGIPELREMNPVQLFDLSAVINGSPKKETVQESKNEPETGDDPFLDGPSIEELIRRIDEKIKNLEDAEEESSEEDSSLEGGPATQNNKDEIIDHTESGIPNEIDLFNDGDYYTAARICIQKIIDNDSIGSRNNLAFLIRFCELDPEKLSGPFSLEIPDLLHAGVEAKDPFSLLNLSLYEIRERHYEKAADLLEQMIPEDWFVVSRFWINSLFYGRNQNPEGALVALLAINHNKCVEFLLFDNTPQSKLMEIARTQFSDFIDSKHFGRIYKTDNEDAGAGNGDSEEDME